ncbi:TIGR04255 family protein [Paraburkholderia flava]|uniref:TIGR04255 family protein n=1 Tax=Paraburkholderia flava TaxID=2547393 RepID=UPI00105DE3BF|nr:TIGR04255 family protein [Paraburkholderia flava]
MQHKRYAKPPIVEAVIDLQTRTNHQPSLDRLTKFRESVVERFPIASPLASMTFVLPVPGQALGQAPVVPTDFANQQVGFRLATSDNSRVLQVQHLGFSFSHLSLYTCWEDFAGEALDLWNRYVEICEPESVVRVATRFINKIRIPEERFELEDYFKLYPTFPREVNDVITGVFMQLRQPLLTVPRALATLNFSDTVENAGTPAAHSAFVLDFDLATEGAWGPSDGETWSVLEEFRRVKNTYFESAITDKCRSLFQ